MEGLANYLLEERPWGQFERFTVNEKTSVKILSVNPGEALSLQTHEHRDEFWRIVSGTGRVRIDERESDAGAGDTFFIPRGSKHRMTAGDTGIAWLEIGLGDFDEGDIKRFEDKYGRP